MTNLSPAAQAVRDAFDIASIDTAIFGDSDRRLAAALRAAADHLDHPTSAHTLYAFADELES